jgi:hypothetical protein
MVYIYATITILIYNYLFTIPILYKMTQDELNTLKEKLPKGYRDVLASEFDCTTTFVDMVLSGTRRNLAMIKKAVELAKEHKKELENLSKEIEAL